MQLCSSGIVSNPLQTCVLKQFQENAFIFGYLRTIEGLNLSGPSSAYRDDELRAISRYARYRRVPGDMLLYHTGEWCDSWFILISGSVLIESSMFLPRS